MDFWDLTVLLVRQWRVALPALLATLVLTVLTLVHVKPSYVSTAYVQLVTPIPVAVPVGETEPTFRNPWLTQSLSTLGNAALVTVQDLTYAHRLASEGYSDNYTVQLGSGNLLIFTVTGENRTQTRNTATIIVAQFDKSVADLQTLYGVAPADMITGQRLDTGSNITLSSGRLKRDLLVIIAFGLLCATGASLLADLRARRLARRLADGQPQLIPAGGPRPPDRDEDAHPTGVSGGAYANIAMPMAGKPAAGSARVPAANRMAPPAIARPGDRAGWVDPAHGPATANMASGSRPTSIAAEPQTRLGAGASRATSSGPPAVDRTDRQRPERPFESVAVVDGPVASGDQPETDEPMAAPAVGDGVTARDDTVVIPKIIYANDK